MDWSICSSKKKKTLEKYWRERIMWPKKLPLQAKEITINDYYAANAYFTDKSFRIRFVPDDCRKMMKMWWIDRFVLAKKRKRWKILIGRESMWPKKLPLRVRETTINGMLLVLILQPSLLEYDSCKKNVEKRWQTWCIDWFVLIEKKRRWKYSWGETHAAKKLPLQTRMVTINGVLQTKNDIDNSD